MLSASKKPESEGERSGGFCSTGWLLSPLTKRESASVDIWSVSMLDGSVLPSKRKRGLI